MKKRIHVVHEHTCGILENQHGTDVGVQKFSNGRWYWVDYADGQNMLRQIRYCPYCGQELDREDENEIK